MALARAFFEGTDDGPLLGASAEMQEASDAAASTSAPRALRDKIQRLETLREQFARLRFAVETLSFVYPCPATTATTAST